MNIYELLERLKTMKTPVFTTNEIARISRLQKPSAIVSIKRMVDKNLLFRVAKGIYSLQDDPILYASYIIPNSYISFNAALFIRGAINQIPATIHVVTPKRVRKRVGGVCFVQLPKRLLFGFNTVQYQGYTIWVAEAEKALLDIAYKFGHSPPVIIKLNNKKMIKYAKKMEINLKEAYI